MTSEKTWTATRRGRLHACLMACLVTLNACTQTTAPEKSASTPPPPETTRSASFSQERAWKQLETLWKMGPRAPGLPGHTKARAHLESQLRESGAKEILVDTFAYRFRGEDRDRELSNISGLYGDPAKGLLLIGTHYDTRLWADQDENPSNQHTPIHGSNDGGSGTAVLLELARVLGESPPPFGVELVFFDGEEAGRNRQMVDYFIGSKRMVERWGEQRDRALPDTVVVIDMVADMDFAIGPDRQSVELFPELNKRIWRSAARLGMAGFVTTMQGPVLDDHVAFMDKGIPSTVLIDFTYPFWHTVEDTIDKCSPDSMGQVGRVLLDALVDEPERSGSNFPK